MLIVVRILVVYFLQCIADIVGYYFGILRRVPYVRFDAVLSIIAMRVRTLLMNQVHSGRSVVEWQFRKVFLQFAYPRLFESDISYAQIGDAFVQVHHLLWCRVISFRAAAFGHDAYYVDLSPAIASVKYLSGSMVTVIVGLSFFSVFRHDDRAKSRHIIGNNVFMLR